LPASGRRLAVWAAEAEMRHSLFGHPLQVKVPGVRCEPSTPTTGDDGRRSAGQVQTFGNSEIQRQYRLKDGTAGMELA
jgi:hypothetical protein